MKNPIKSLVATAVFAALALGANAQPAVKIVMVDMAKLYDTHWRTVEHTTKLQADEQKAHEEVERMNKEGNVLLEQYKSFDEQLKNPAASAESKNKTQQEAQKKLEEINNKQREVQAFVQTTRNTLGQRLNTFRGLMLEEISKTAGEIAKRKGATLLLDKAGPTAIGISNIVYADPGFDITEEVSKELNKDRPAGAPTAPPSAEKGGAAPAPAGTTPPVSVPNFGGAKK
jgi:outer membrane protein